MVAGEGVRICYRLKGGGPDLDPHGALHRGGGIKSAAYAHLEVVGSYGRAWRRERSKMSVLRLASTYEELGFFALSFVPVATGPVESAAKAARIFRPKWATPSASRPFEEDREALLAYSHGGILSAQWLPRLFAEKADVHSLLRVAAKTPFEELGAHAGIEPYAYATMRGSDSRLTELLLCDMALAVTAFEHEVVPILEERRAACVPSVEAALVELGAIVPRLQCVEPTLAGMLGVSGRVFPGPEGPTIYVGLADAEPSSAAREAALLALHELAVFLANDAYSWAERAAIDAVSVLVRGTAFEADHARRLARFDLSMLPKAGACLELAGHVVDALRQKD